MDIQWGRRAEYARADFSPKIEQALRTKAETAGKMTETMAKGSRAGQAKSPEEELLYSMAVGKLRSGQELSGYEMLMIKKRDPALYAKAVRAQKARQELRRRLERAKSSREFAAEKTAINTLATCSGLGASDAKSSGDAEIVDGERLITSTALKDEYGRFAAKREGIERRELALKNQIKTGEQLRDELSRIRRRMKNAANH